MCGARAAGDGVVSKCGRGGAKPASARSADENAGSGNQPDATDAQHAADQHQHRDESEGGTEPPALTAALSGASPPGDSTSEPFAAVTENVSDAAARERSNASALAEPSATGAEADDAQAGTRTAQTGASSRSSSAIDSPAQRPAEITTVDCGAQSAHGSVLAEVAAGGAPRPRRSSGAVWNTAAYRHLWQLAVAAGEAQAAAGDEPSAALGAEAAERGDYAIGTDVARTGAREAAASLQHGDGDALAEAPSLSTRAAAEAGRGGVDDEVETVEASGEPGATHALMCADEEATPIDALASASASSSGQSESDEEIVCDGRDPMERYSITTVSGGAQDGATS